MPTAKLLGIGWCVFLLMSGFGWTQKAAEKAKAEKAKAESAKATESESWSIPDGLENFNGMLIGKLVSKDIEKGSFVVKVDYVSRVWRNNKAKRPRAAVGKTLRVEDVSGKWLDQLLLIRKGETMEFEAQHRGGDSLRFPGELLQKAPPFDPSQHPVPPAGFRGFRGVVTGQIERRNQTGRELILKIKSIEKTSERNRAERAQEVVGHQIVLAGFWANMSKPFDDLDVGDTIRAGVEHRSPQSDHFSVMQFAEKVDGEHQ